VVSVSNNTKTTRANNIASPRCLSPTMSGGGNSSKPALASMAAVANNAFFLLLGIFLGIFLVSTTTIQSYHEDEKGVRMPPSASSSGQLRRLLERTQSAAVTGATGDDGGWSTVHVFYGNKSHLAEASTIPVDYYASTEWFSQVRQDEIVSGLLRGKRNGYFVDLASNDAVRISNTYALESNWGWTGLCIEPNPIYWSSLSYRINCRVVGAVVGNGTMDEVRFKFPNRMPARGGIVGFDNKVPSRFQEDATRYTVSLAEIFKRFGAPPVLDYLSLDVEGAEYYVLQNFPFESYRFNVMTIERPQARLASLLEQHGYSMLKVLNTKRGETIWAHRSVQSHLDLSVLDRIDVEHYVYREKPRLQQQQER